MTDTSFVEKVPEERLRLQIEAYHVSALVYAAVKLDLADRMGSDPWRVEQLAEVMDLSPPHLFRFLRVLRRSAFVKSCPIRPLL